MPGKFENKRVVIAGGSTGIGFATAALLVAAGASVTITGRSVEKLEQAKAAIPSLNTVVLDSNNRQELDQFFQSMGMFDHLVLTLSGGKGAGAFATLPLDDLRTGFEGKFWPQLNTLQSAIPYVDKAGSITLVTAASAAMHTPGVAGLAAINGSLELMIPSIAKELQPLRINAVSPGVVDTPWWDAMTPADKAAAFTHFAAQTLTGRIAEPEELADAILFLMGNRNVTGTVIRCDGGISL